MPKVLTDINKKIENHILEVNRVKREARKRSGKFSPTQLGKPLLWQLLSVHGFTESFDAYTLLKFLRGEQVEAWYTQFLDGAKQVPIAYRDCIGYCDSVASEENGTSLLTPDEIKSVTGKKYKRIVEQKSADINHRLQATYYALGLDSNLYRLHYVNCDDLRVYILEYDINEPVSDEDKRTTKDVVEQEITDFQKWFATGKLPAFAPKVKWQSDPRYMNYKDWNKLSEEEVNKKFQTLQIQKSNGTPPRDNFGTDHPHQY